MPGETLSPLDTAHDAGRWIVLTRPTDEREHVAGQRVGVLWPSLLWHQRGQPSLLEGGLRLIEGGTREAKGHR